MTTAKTNNSRHLFQPVRVPAICAAFVFFVLLVSSASIHAQTTEFTYQGSLNSAGTPATGSYDFEFLLFDALAGGSQLGATQTRTNVSVANGVFSVELDFGNQFPGADRFLEIRVRQSGGAAFTTLDPRQRVNSSPYSVKSLEAENASNADIATNAMQLGGVAANQYVITTDPRMSDARTPTAGSASYIQNQNAGVQASSNFNISGNGTAGGTLSGNIVNSATQYNIGGNRVLSVGGSGNVFAGVGAGQSNPTGAGNAFFGANAGRDNTTGFANSFFGTLAGEFNTTGDTNSFFGNLAGSLNKTGSDNTIIGRTANVSLSNLTNATAIGARARVGSSNTMVLGSIAGVNGAAASTRVTIGDTVGYQTRLSVFGGPNWTSALWGGAIGLSNVTAIGWSTNSAGNAFGIGQSNGGMYFFRTINNLGGTLFPPIYNLFIGDNDRVGIGTVVPDAKLSVNGTATKTGGGSWGNFSDERLKDIKGGFTPGLNAVMGLTPLRYEYKKDNALDLNSEGEHIGFSAQDVEKYIPEAVTKNDRGYRIVNNDPIIWTMLNAVKEQQAMIEAQAAEIKDSVSENARLRSKVDTHERRFERQKAEIDGLKALVCAANPAADLCRPRKEK